MTTEKRMLMTNILEWTGRVGKGLDDLSSEERRVGRIPHPAGSSLNKWGIV